MSAIIDAPILTTAELLALPDNGVERWLAEGHLREKPMTVRNRFHSRTMVRTSKYLDNWNDLQPEPRGEVLCGEVGCRLRRDPDSTYGLDVAYYVAANLVVQQPDDTTLIDGVPTLIIEILSPSDTMEDIDEKIDAYQKAGVPLIWVIDPHDRTVTIYTLNAEPLTLNCTQELTAEPFLPGFKVAVKDIFA